MNLDSGTAEILSGDFAHDAILTKAEQLTKHEVSIHLDSVTVILFVQWFFVVFCPAIITKRGTNAGFHTEGWEPWDPPPPPGNMKN